MIEFLRQFGLAFVPIFVAVDAIGVLPMYMGLVEGVEAPVRRRIVGQAAVTALALAIGFTLLGEVVLRLIGVTVADFKVAGGVVLFIIAAIDIISARKFARDATTLGAVPIGTPLIVGPAVLTSSIMLVGVYGYGPTLAALVANILIAMALLLAGERVFRVVGQAGSRAVTKVANLIMAAFAVMMIRSGILEIIAEAVRAKP